MPNFTYTARSNDGSPIQGELEAGTEQLVAEQLLRRGDEIEQDGWLLRVLTVEGRRAGQVEVIGPAERR